MQLEPGSIDYGLIKGELDDVLALLDARRDEIRIYAPGAKARPIGGTASAKRLCVRLNRDWRTLERLIIGTTILRSDGSAHGPPMTIAILKRFACRISASG